MTIACNFVTSQKVHAGRLQRAPSRTRGKYLPVRSAAASLLQTVLEGTRRNHRKASWLHSVIKLT